MRLYRTTAGLARGEGDELALLDLPHLDVADLLSEGIERARSARVRSRIPMRDAVLLPPVAAPGTVVIAGANYRDHVAEAGMPTPTAPVFITVTGVSATGPHDPIWLPAEAPRRSTTRQNSPWWSAGRGGTSRWDGRGTTSRG